MKYESRLRTTNQQQSDRKLSPFGHSDIRASFVMRAWGFHFSGSSRLTILKDGLSTA
jgi:hypothetical protein